MAKKATPTPKRRPVKRPIAHRVEGAFSNITIRVSYPEENPPETLRDVTTALRVAGLLDDIQKEDPGC